MAEIVDQSNYTGATAIGFGDTGGGRDYMVQGFIPRFNNITALSFHITSKDGSTDVGYAVWVDRADTNSNPLGAVAVGVGGFTEITNASLVLNSLTKYNLASRVTLSPGQQYVLCFAPWNTTTHVFASSYHDWVTSTANPYPYGRRVHLDGSFATPVAPDSGNDDILFETYGERPSFSVNKLRPAIFKPGLAR